MHAREAPSRKPKVQRPRPVEDRLSDSHGAVMALQSWVFVDPMADRDGAPRMIMRTWRGSVRTIDAARHLEHQAGTGVREYRQTPGNLGTLVLRRDRGEMCEVTTVSFWESMEAVRRFAGDDPGQAKFYPGDDELLVEKDLHVDHYTVVTADLSASMLTVLPR
jgi:heme-degrading monooxygenase HmoA